jgi:hypothetical protein
MGARREPITLGGVSMIEKHSIKPRLWRGLRLWDIRDEVSKREEEACTAKVY